MPDRSRALIAIDLDGTALSDLRTLCPYTVRALKAAKSRGHVVMIATARPSCMTIAHYRTLGLDTPMSLLNGSYLYNPTDATFARVEHLIPEETALAAMALLREAGAHDFWVENDDDLYITGQMTSGEYFDEMCRLSRVHKTAQLPVMPFARLFAALRDSGAAGIASDKLSALPGISCRAWTRQDGTATISIASIQSDKWFTVKAVAEHFGIPRERIITFGDESNDRMMILKAGHGFAMLNGNPALQEEALANGASVTSRIHAEGGVGYEVERLLPDA